MTEFTPTQGMLWNTGIRALEVALQDGVCGVLTAGLDGHVHIIAVGVDPAGLLRTLRDSDWPSMVRAAEEWNP